METFSVKIVVCDHYMTTPIPDLDVTSSEFRGSEIKQVPVLRIFGPALDGLKVCLHVHGVFPYFYIPCANPKPEPQFLYQVANSLDKALNISMKQASSQEQHVYKISLVRGIPFYGYHTREHLFFKIFLYNPGHLKQAVELFQNGAILGQVFQAYEAHLNFTLQFFIDFNLFGMSCIDLQHVQFRKTPNAKVDTLMCGKDATIDDFTLETIKAISCCIYEGDCLACNILNRQKVDKNDGQDNPGLEAVWNEEKERRRKLNISLNQILSPTQDRAGIQQTDTHENFKSLFWQRMLLHEKDLSPESLPLSSSEESTLKNPIVNDHSSFLNRSIYPIENMDSSLCTVATEITFHHPAGSFLNTDTTQEIGMDNTIVDETLALNCSLSQGRSQVTLSNDDMEFLEVLESMEEKPDNDSIIGSQLNLKIFNEDSSDSDDYSKMFEEDDVTLSLKNNIDMAATLLTNSNNDSPNDWADSFWEGVDNIPQLDGSIDDIEQNSHHRQSGRVLKNKSLGIARNKSLHPRNKIESKLKYNAEKMNNIETVSLIHHQNHNVICPSDMNKTAENTSIAATYLYDAQNNFFPQATGSKDQTAETITGLNTPSALDETGIVSFYDMSLTLDSGQRPKIGEINSNETLTFNCSFDSISSLSNKRKADDQIVESKVITKLEAVTNSNKVHILRAFHPSPTSAQLVSTLGDYELPENRYIDPFYSNYNDVTRRIDVGSVTLKLLSNSIHHLMPFDSTLEGVNSIEKWRKDLFLSNNNMSQSLPSITDLDSLLASNRKVVLRSVLSPPSPRDAQQWVGKNSLSNLQMNKNNEIIINDKNASEINIDSTEESKEFEISDQVVLENSLFLSKQPDGSFLCHDSSLESQSQSPNESSYTTESDFMTVMVLELHSDVRENLHPDPEVDGIRALFYKITNDCPRGHALPQQITGIIIVKLETANPEFNPILKDCGTDYKIEYVESESDLIETFLRIFRSSDPDIICGFEIEMQSWGYLFERCHHLRINLIVELSRIQITKKQSAWRNSQEPNELKLIGRVVFSLWRLLRHEVALSSYSFENTMYHILNERVPVYTYRKLSECWNHSAHLLRWLTVEYYMTRVCGVFRMMDKLDLIKRTSELARLFGLQWWEVFSRGSQFRVESLMLRAARPLNLVAFSPSVSQRAAMKAPECLPLIFEPESRFYSDPVIVLDFQSLYPSMMIAYNYCFSTCIGRVQYMGKDSAYEFGAWQLRISKERLKRLAMKDMINWSPVGVGFVKPQVRRGVLPALLKRILAARQAVKKGAKLQTDESVKKAMHARQLGLKLIANVTYGYTAANFSGRMPCVEVADSVVAKGRETLEKAIKLVEKIKKWNARVVYGDTDSMFVLVKGRSVAQAFKIGAEIAAAVTADNPSPVALKLEKVYQPCILQTKKRYVGNQYETGDQTAPTFEAKGIETVRRDGCVASVKILEDALRELFNSRDMSKVRHLVCERLSALIEGRMPILDLVFTREFHGFKGYRSGAAAPPLEIAKRLLAVDRRAVPRVGERVGWIVTAGAPGSALVHLARSRAEMSASGLRPYVTYYISRAILPPLARCLSLLGANVFQWYEELPRHFNIGIGGIAQYLWKETCSSCGIRTSKSVCDKCLENPSQTMFALQETLHSFSSKNQGLSMICKSCCGSQSIEACTSYECPVFWKRKTVKHYFQESQQLIENLSAELEF